MRILVVEDEPDLREGLIQALREAGYATDGAENGKEGLFKAQGCQYDCIVLDWMLPVMTGLEMLKSLRESHSTPVLLLTARDAVADRVEGLDSGADDYLVKPFLLDELTARIRALIRRTSGNSSSVIEIGPVSVDSAAGRVTLYGNPVELTATEYRLVELLAMHRGRLVSRTMIYDHLFDENHDSLSNLVDVYISRLRARLGKEFIQTRRGQGYIVDG